MASRRSFLRFAGLAAAGGAIAVAIPFSKLARAKGQRVAITSGESPDLVFPQSVASGDPTPTGAIVWTRLAPVRYAPGEPLVLQVATDARFSEILHEGAVPAGAFGASTDWTVRVDLDGTLAPDRHYFYRFLHDGVATRTGRLRTLPEEGAVVERVRFAVITCQNFQNGYFTALGQVADEDVDFVVHLGDFIYEYNGESSYNGKSFPGRGIALPSGAAQMQTKEDLSYVWQRYRGDKHLQAMLERHTLIATWDDHEITNDRYFDYTEGRYYGDEGFALNGDPEACDAFFRDGAKAYFDWMPLRIRLDRDAADPLDVIKLYRSFRFGDLVELFALDERWYRSAPLVQGLFTPSEHMVSAVPGPNDDPSRTMLGEAQRDWLFQGLRASTRAWKVLANQVQVSPLAATLPGTSVYLNFDAWDGYEAERRALADVLGQVRGGVVLTGDLHSFMVGYVMRDFNLGLAGRVAPGNLVAVEFMTPGITSAGLGEIIEQATGVGPYPGCDEAHENAVLAGNPHMLHFNSYRHGYSIVEFTRTSARYSGYVVDKSTQTAAGNRFLLSVYEASLDRVGLSEIHRGSPSGLPTTSAIPPAATGARVEVKDPHDLPEALRTGGRSRAPAALFPSGSS